MRFSAEQITSPHPVEVPHGLESPPGRLYELDGQVLLLGVGHDADTTIHVAEDIAGVRYRQPKHVSDKRQRALRSRDIVCAALERLRRNETVFLHASGSCGECDAARAGAVPFGA